MSLERWWKTHQDYTGLASATARQIAFAGIAIVWVLSNNEPGQVTLPIPLLWPSLCFVLALAFDFLQYFCSSIIWHVYVIRKEKALGVDYKGDEAHSSYLNKPGEVLYYGKCTSVVAGYAFLAKYIISAMAIV